MNRYAGYLVAVLFGILLGYFAGREHVKYEMRSAIESAAEGISESLSAAFGGNSEPNRERQKRSGDGRQEREGDDPAKAAYIDEHLELYDVSAEFKDSMFDGTVPAVIFKIRNGGERSLDKVEVTVYFKDGHGNVIAEEDYSPVLVTRYSVSGGNKPLRPGYIWQMEQGKFYAAKQVPSEWKEGSIDASITDIRFTQ